MGKYRGFNIEPMSSAGSGGFVRAFCPFYGPMQDARKSQIRLNSFLEDPDTGTILALWFGFVAADQNVFVAQTDLSRMLFRRYAQSAFVTNSTGTIPMQPRPKNGAALLSLVFSGLYCGNLP